jgi:hypothetical protein
MLAVVPVLDDRILAQLHPAERVVWTGHPDASLLFTRADGFLIPFTALWAAFAVFWNVRVWSTGQPLIFRIWGVPFLLMGAYILVGRFIVRRRRYRGTRYALTDRRALIVGPGATVTAVPLETTPLVSEASRDNSHLTVWFGGHPTWRKNGLVGGDVGLGLPGRPSGPPAFRDVADVAALSAALRSIGRNSDA